MERKFDQSHNSNTWGEIRRKLSQGLRDTRSGVIHLGKGIFEVVKGSVEAIDAAALGLGVIAVLTLGGLGIAPVWALVSRDKSIVDTEQEIARLSTDPSVARIFGYLLLSFAGVYSYLSLREK